MAVRVVEEIYKKKKQTCYLCTEKHREIGHEHRGKHREFNLNPNVATLKNHVNAAFKIYRTNDLDP